MRLSNNSKVLGRVDETGFAKNFNSPDEDIRAIISETANPLHHLKVIAGHMPYGLHQKIGRDVRYLAFMREPISRALSWYNMALDETVMFPLRRTVSDFGGDIAKAINSGNALEFTNDQTRMLIGSRNIKLDDKDLEQAKEIIQNHYIFVGTQENIKECLCYVSDKLNLEYFDPATLNIGRNAESMSTDLRRTFEKYNDIDMKLYEWLTTEYIPRMLTE